MSLISQVSAVESLTELEDLIDPTEDRMLVRMDPDSDKLSDRIVAPENARDTGQIGTIVKIGPLTDASVYCPGIRVLVSPFAGYAFGQEGVEGDSIKMVVPSDILGVLE